MGAIYSLFANGARVILFKDDFQGLVLGIPRHRNVVYIINIFYCILRLFKSSPAMPALSRHMSVSSERP
jgi:hypothetical protein